MTTLIHLDTDIGGDSDDLCALAMLLGWLGVALAGVTTVLDSGGQRAALATYVLRLAGRSEVPVAAGAAGSLGQYPYPEPPGLPNLARYWSEPVPARPGPPGAALDLLAHSIERGATIVAIGPLTNLALLEAARPGLLASAPLVVMGGWIMPAAVGLPPWGPAMDFNIQADAIAARLVFERAHPLLVPLPLCLSVPLRAAELPALKQGGPLARLVAHQSELHGADSGKTALGPRYPALPDDLLNFQYDPLACAVAVGWDGARVEELPLSPRVEDGWLSFTVAPGGKPTRVVMAVDAARFATDWGSAVARAVDAR